jgi:hypothetical protein
MLGLWVLRSSNDIPGCLVFLFLIIELDFRCICSRRNFDQPYVAKAATALNEGTESFIQENPESMDLMLHLSLETEFLYG